MPTPFRKQINGAWKYAEQTLGCWLYTHWQLVSVNRRKEMKHFNNIKSSNPLLHRTSVLTLFWCIRTGTQTQYSTVVMYYTVAVTLLCYLLSMLNFAPNNEVAFCTYVLAVGICAVGKYASSVSYLCSFISYHLPGQLNYTQSDQKVSLQLIITVQKHAKVFLKVSNIQRDNVVRIKENSCR
jgi:hypothetical protein